jgi:hypothetical protein
MYASRAIRFTLTWAQRRMFLYSVLGFEALVGADVLLNDGAYGGGIGTASVGVLLLAMAAAMRFVGISLTDKHAVVHSIPRHAHPVARRQRGRDRARVRREDRRAAPRPGPPDAPHRADDRPVGVRDEAFQEKVGVIRSFWAKHRDIAVA